MVPIFTYRDERKLFTVIGGVLVAALIVALQIQSVRSGKANPLTITVSTVLGAGQVVVSAVSSAVTGMFEGIGAIPRLWQENAQLQARNRDLNTENIRLREEVTRLGGARAIERISSSHPRGIMADTIGYDPENLSHTITIDRGSLSHIIADQGVINDEGIVGRVLQVTPFASKVLLITDPASRVPAVVQKGHWWGLATGINGRVQLQYISQDAPLKIGDTVITGEGLSFHSGLPIGQIAKIYHSDGALYQTALIEPAVSLGRLGHVLVVPK